MTRAGVTPPMCSTIEHREDVAYAVVHLGDCDCGDRRECGGHPYCQTCVMTLGAGGHNVIGRMLTKPRDRKGEALTIALASLYETAHAGCEVDRTLARTAIKDINAVLFGDGTLRGSTPPKSVHLGPGRTDETEAANGER